MGRVRIVTDSTVSLKSPNLLKTHAIEVLPLQVGTPEGAVEEQPGMDVAEYAHLFQDPQHRPTAQAPSVEAIGQVFEKLQVDCEAILVLPSSAALFPLYSLACQAAGRYLGKCKIQVLDTMTFSAGLGLLVEEAARAVEQGVPFDEVVRLVRGTIARLYAVFFLTDMFYLERRRLVSRSQAILGNMLGVLPFLLLDEGRLIPMEKVRNRQRALDKLIEFVTEFSDIEHLIILTPSARPAQEACWLRDRLLEVYPDLRFSFAPYGPSVATWVGIDGMGVVVLEAEEDL